MSNGLPSQQANFVNRESGAVQKWSPSVTCVQRSKRAMRCFKRIALFIRPQEGTCVKMQEKYKTLRVQQPDKSPEF